MEEDGTLVYVFQDEGYFYCTMEKGNIEVCADSRANVKPRTVKEAICLAALKINIPSDKPSWDKILSALDLTHLIKK